MISFIDSTWYTQAIDHEDVEQGDLVEVKPKMGTQFAMYHLKLNRQRDAFEKQFNRTMEQIQDYYGNEESIQEDKLIKKANTS